MQLKLSELMSLPPDTVVLVGKVQHYWKGVQRNPKVEDPRGDEAWFLAFERVVPYGPDSPWNNRQVKIDRENPDHLYNISTNLDDVPCEQCGKMVDADKVHKAKIYINRGTQVQSFCSGTCASHRQMGAEG